MVYGMALGKAIWQIYGVPGFFTVTACLLLLVVVVVVLMASAVLAAVVSTSPSSPYHIFTWDSNAYVHIWTWTWTFTYNVITLYKSVYNNQAVNKLPCVFRVWGGIFGTKIFFASQSFMCTWMCCVYVLASVLVRTYIHMRWWVHKTYKVLYKQNLYVFVFYIMSLSSASFMCCHGIYHIHTSAHTCSPHTNIKIISFYLTSPFFHHHHLLFLFLSFSLKIHYFCTLLHVKRSRKQYQSD